MSRGERFLQCSVRRAITRRRRNHDSRWKGQKATGESLFGIERFLSERASEREREKNHSENNEARNAPPSVAVPRIRCATRVTLTSFERCTRNDGRTCKWVENAETSGIRPRQGILRFVIFNALFRSHISADERAYISPARLITMITNT